MYTEAKKLNLIELLLNEKNEQVLKSVEQILAKSDNHISGRFTRFSNILDTEEIGIFEKNISDGCEQVNESDWK